MSGIDAINAEVVKVNKILDQVAETLTAFVTLSATAAALQTQLAQYASSDASLLALSDQLEAHRVIVADKLAEIVAPPAPVDPPAPEPAPSA